MLLENMIRETFNLLLIFSFEITNSQENLFKIFSDQSRRLIVQINGSLNFFLIYHSFNIVEVLSYKLCINELQILQQVQNEDVDTFHNLIVINCVELRDKFIHYFRLRLWPTVPISLHFYIFMNILQIILLQLISSL